MSETNIENVIRRELERMGVRAEDEQQRDQAAPEQPPIPVEAILSDAIGGPLALNNDQALGRIAGGPNATVNARPINI